MSLAEVSIDRSDMDGSPAPIVIASDGATYRLTEDGVGHVIRSVEVTTAPDSIDIDGSEVVAFRRLATGLPLEFHVIGETSAALEDAVEALEDALFRLDYPVTRTVDGVGRTYSGGPCGLTPKRGNVDSGVLAQHFETYTVTIPFMNPNSTPVDES